MLRRQQKTLSKLLHALGDFIEGVGQRLDVLTLQGRNESLAEMFGEFLGEAFVLRANLGEWVQRLETLGLLYQLHKKSDAGARLLRAPFHEFKEPVIFAQNLLQGKHN